MSNPGEVGFREARLEAGLTLAELARRSGLTSAMLSTYERGRTRPSLNNIEAIARGMGKPPLVVAGYFLRPAEESTQH